MVLRNQGQGLFQSLLIDHEMGTPQPLEANSPPTRTNLELRLRQRNLQLEFLILRLSGKKTESEPNHGFYFL